MVHVLYNYIYIYILWKVRDCSSNAAWRTSRLGHWDLLKMIRENGQLISPLLQAPWVDTSIFRVDWLHCADLGVTADWLGSQFIMISKKLPGRSRKVQCQALWGLMQDFYKSDSVTDRLQGFRPSMLQMPGKAPKLRASAAQCRALVPFASKLSQERLDAADHIEAAARRGMMSLHECYRALSKDSIFASDVLKAKSTSFAQQYVALEHAHRTESGKMYKIKPKLHMFLELCSDGSKPALFWNYRDEDWGGSVARMSRSRGGAKNPKSFSQNVLWRFRIQQPMIRM